MSACSCLTQPTETVYGLGAHALNEDAVHNIFTFKGRPLDDPVIVHVHSVERARPLYTLTEDESRIFDVLSAAFWPGPMTIVARAASCVPSIVMAGGSTVGVRIPHHPIALALLEACDLPVAAPSANRFGHVSPTTAQHVYDDLSAHDVLILDGGAARVGVESTVVQLADNTLTVLRRGGVSLSALREAVHHTLPDVVVTAKVSVGPTSLTPGQHLKHYAPANAPAFVISDDCTAPSEGSIALSSTAIIDMGGRLAQLRSITAFYYDISPKSDTAEGSAQIYTALRRVESEDVEAILLPDLSGLDVASTGPDERALVDKVFRATQGRTGHVDGARFVRHVAVERSHGEVVDGA